MPCRACPERESCAELCDEVKELLKADGLGNEDPPDQRDNRGRRVIVDTAAAERAVSGVALQADFVLDGRRTEDCVDYFSRGYSRRLAAALNYDDGEM